MAFIDLLDPRDDEDPDVAKWSDRLTRPDGSLGNHFKAEAHFPEVMMNVYDARTAIARHRELGPTLTLKIALAISMVNRCVYCTGAFCSLLSRRWESDDETREFQQALAADTLEGKEADVIDFVLKAHEDPHSLAEADYQSLRQEYNFSEKGFVALIYAANIFSGYNRVTVGFDLEYDHDYPEEWAASETIRRDWLH